VVGVIIRVTGLILFIQFMRNNPPEEIEIEETSNV
jgi:hypothetical protein